MRTDGQGFHDLKDTCPKGAAVPPPATVNHPPPETAEAVALNARG